MMRTWHLMNDILS